MSDWKKVRDMPPLDDEERRVLVDSGTEEAGTGKYVDFFEDGIYVCRQCGAPLYRSDDKFETSCGWPGFDDEITGAVDMRQDPNPERPWTEILCANCRGHLGHVFEGEGFTPKNIRHCVNSLSIAHVATESALLAGGCFWGVEEIFRQLEGVILTEVGYAGGSAVNPKYEEVKRGKTGHAEVAKIGFDPAVIDYAGILRIFFEIHDPTQKDRQGEDVGHQYRSAVFYYDDRQRLIAEATISQLKAKGIDAVTEIVPFVNFYPAEDYHQKYFEKNQDKLSMSCHIRRKIDWD
ncbi:MAG: bifunctional methionine sulfoxide reductase B/A protein [Synergistaceae bacterium]|nr:bifunctional methionine sulfoxide reductase B/A protein [Synergistaceae bacterium]